MSLVQFINNNGLSTLINSESVLAMQDDHFSPGGRYQPGCTVHLSTGQKVHLDVSVSEASRRLWPST